MKRVIVGLSGGVDSSVAAYLLKEQGYEVIGLFMKNWHDDSVTISNECPWLDDSNDAMLVADKLGIPFQTVDLSEQYKERIVDYMFKEYKNGRTPNPDVLCNREIKFDVFMKIAMELGADYVATGHYCRKGVISKNSKDIYQLLAGVDPNKDQSYFLCQLSQHQLSRSLFPIGELTKPEVREIASKLDLVTAEKKDSQGLCFIGKVKLPDFLQQQLKPKEGLPFKRRVFIGEYGGHAFDDKPETHLRQFDNVKDIMQISLEEDLPFALHWQMYNNEYTDDGKSKNMSLINEKGEKRPMYYLHQNYYKQVNDYLKKYNAEYKVYPSLDDFKMEALKVLDDVYNEIRLEVLPSLNSKE